MPARPKTSFWRVTLLLASFGFLLICFQNFDLPGAANITTATSVSSGNVRTIPFSCHAANNSAGCEKTVRCPYGYRPREAKALCNLEGVSVDQTALAALAPNSIRVLTSSKVAAEGQCHVHSTRAREGAVEISLLPKYTSSFAIGCRELSDSASNGGDCGIYGELVCEKFDGHLFVMEAQTDPASPYDGTVLQGLAQVDGNHWLVTQNPSESGLLVFTLVDREGRFIREWRSENGGHGQSLWVGKLSNRVNSPLRVLTESASGRGLSEFELSADYQTLTFKGEIEPKNAKGRPISIKTFGILRQPRPQVSMIAVSRVHEKRRKVQLFELTDFLNGIATPISNEFVLPLGSEVGLPKAEGLDIGNQGIALLPSGIVALSGNSAVSSPKLIHRFSIEDGPQGKLVGTKTQVFRIIAGGTLARQEGNYLEPEGIHVHGKEIFFSLNTGNSTHRIKRIFRMTDDYWQSNPTAEAASED